MIYGFETDNRDTATAALLVYAIYRSRDRRRFKVTPDMWGQIERFTQGAAKRATNLPRFMQALKPRIACDTIHPHAMEVGIKGRVALVEMGDGSLMQPAADPEAREFLAGVLDRVDHKAVLDLLYRETTWIILLVRTRLEAEKPAERRFETVLDTIGVEVR